MSSFRAKSPLLAVVKTAAALAALLLTGCPNGDVGAPCNHGRVNAPSSFLVTFPALSCDNLLCIYGEDKQATEADCMSHSECNPDGKTAFQCIDGTCELSLDYVLERSMCSRSCSKDDDCKNNGAFDNNAVENDEPACTNGFKCVVLQELGQFCCQKLCVCDDDLPNLEMVNNDCMVIGASGEPAVCED